MASPLEETASDCERRRARRRERRAKRAERHAARGSTSPNKSNTTVASYALDDDQETEQGGLPSTPPKPTNAALHTTHHSKDSHRSTNIYPPPTPTNPTPAKTPYDYLDREQYSYDDSHKRESSGRGKRRERYDRHDLEGRQHHHDHRDHQHRDEKRRERRHRHDHNDHEHQREYRNRQQTDEKRKSHHSYKIKETYEEYDEHESIFKTIFKRWSWRKKALIISIPIILIVIIALAAATAVSKKHSFKYTPSYSQVTNSSAFTNGGASTNANDTDDGIGAGTDRYVYYSGPASNFPPKGQWVSFANMWEANRNSILHACSILGYGKDDTGEEIKAIYDAIQSRATASLVDHRLILAVVLQESHGCVRIPSTNNGVKNPGLMQSYNGASFSPYHPTQSILQMVQDGTQGTKSGPGLVQHLNSHGNAYSAARMYNSGAIADNGDLSHANGATACYVSDIANRLTGWMYADSSCPDATS